MTKLTELEGAVLGLIWRDGPITTYAIRSVFSKSRSSHFSGSAGAIYPLVERLKETRLVHATLHKHGSRQSHRFSITPAGKQALRQWLSQSKDAMAAVEFDPIRTRVHFLAALTPQQRKSFLRDSIASLQQEIEETELMIEARRQTDDKWSVHGAEGALRTLKARVAWLRDILDSESTNRP